MPMKSLAIALLATALLGGAAINRAEAVVLGPATIDTTALTDQTLQNARWVCTESRCNWVPYAIFQPRPSYAMNWNAPRTPGCFYEKRRGRWREKCPQ